MTYTISKGLAYTTTLNTITSLISVHYHSKHYNLVDQQQQFTTEYSTLVDNTVFFMFNIVFTAQAIYIKNVFGVPRPTFKELINIETFFGLHVSTACC